MMVAFFLDGPLKKFDLATSGQGQYGKCRRQAANRMNIMWGSIEHRVRVQHIQLTLLPLHAVVHEIAHDRFGGMIEV